MTGAPCCFVYLPGAGGGEADLSVLRASLGDAYRFETVDYPGWQSYICDGFSTGMLIEQLATQMAARVPQGPILIASASLGGHFAYAASLQLQQMGREIAGFLAIDAFMIDSSGPTVGWQSRAMDMGLDLVRKGDLGNLVRFVRSRFWRAMFRLSGGRLRDLLRQSAPSDRLPFPLSIDPIAEGELSMRLLLRAVAPWAPSLDRDPAPLHAPATLLRTPATASDDAAWLRRCPEMKIYEIPGQHLTLFEPENIGSLRDAFIRATSDWCTFGQ
jgi:thioesterase domain-containing protein